MTRRRSWAGVSGWLGMLALVAGTPAQAVAGEPPTAAEPLAAGSHDRILEVAGRRRSYLLHMPDDDTAARPAALVLALHGAGMNGRLMRWATGLSEKADEAGFVVAYPDGTGRGPFLVWNVGWGGRGLRDGRADEPDDVRFLTAVIDDIARLTPIDPRRVYACGFSNGGMMCYRLAAEVPERFAAIAPVAGVVAGDPAPPAVPVPVLHIHGTADSIVPYGRPVAIGRGVRFRDVPDSVALWVKFNGCDAAGPEESLAEACGLRVTRRRHAGGCDGADVVLVTIGGGGHTWPGRRPPLWLLGASTETVAANDLIWEFFDRHRR
jgi:polyhydroxybutyrate depolymerase